MNSEQITRTVVRECSPERPRSDTASMVELPSGLLLCAYHSYSPGPDGGGDFGAARIYVKESADGGVTWENERLLVDVDPGDLNVMCPCLALVEGRLLLLYLINHEKAVSSTLICFSTDEGKTFSQPVAIWDHIREHRFCGYDGFIRIDRDRLLVPFQTSAEVWTPGEHITVGTILSSDGGETWTERGHRIDLPLRGVMEPSIAQLDRGRLLMSVRSQLGAVFLSESDDEGETWSLPQTTGLKSPESCTCLRRVLGTDSLVLFWNDSEYEPEHHHYGQRSPLSVARSTDGGRTWKRLFDIEDEKWYEYTNLGCLFTFQGNAILTYLESAGGPDSSFGRDCMRLKAAVIPAGRLG